MTIHPMHTFTDDDREAFQYWLGRIPSGGAEEAVFNALALKFKHDTAGLHTATRGLIDLHDRAEARTSALLTIVEEQAKQITTLASEYTETAAVLRQAVVRLDQGVTVVESLQQQDVAQIQAAIGTPDDRDRRTIHEHLRDLDAGQRQMGVAYAVLAAMLILLVLGLYAFGTPEPVFGVIP